MRTELKFSVWLPDQHGMQITFLYNARAFLEITKKTYIYNLAQILKA